MKKKSQSISINTIVVASIALIVLVIIIAIFSDRIGIVGREVRSCTSQGGIGCFTSCDWETVKEEDSSAEPGTYTNLPGTNCVDNEETSGKTQCCKLLFSEE